MIGRYLPPTWSPLTARAVLGARRSAAQASADQLTLRANLKRRHDALDVLLTDSGTSALRLALTVVTTRPAAPRLVALPAWSCYDLATAADGAGVDVVLYDLDPATLAPDWASFDAALSHRPAAAVVVLPFGIPMPIAEARRRAHAQGALLIEDAAQAVSATIDGRAVGSQGDFGILSFGRGKGWTGGGGGALLLGAGSPADIALPSFEALEAPGGSGGVLAKSLIQWGLGRPSLYGIPASLPFLGLGQTVYHPPHAPRQPTPAMAAMLLATEPMLGSEVAIRRNHADRLRAAVEGSGIGTVPVASLGEAGWLRLPFIPNDQTLARLREGSAHHLGILPGYPIALAKLPGFAERLRHITPTPGAERLAERLHTLPTHSLLTEADLVRIEQWIRSAA